MTIYSDQWHAFSAISRINNEPHRYIHQTVEVDHTHSTSLLQPYFGAYIKYRKYVDSGEDEEKNQMVQHCSLLDTHLAEFTW